MAGHASVRPAQRPAGTGALSAPAAVTAVVFGALAWTSVEVTAQIVWGGLAMAAWCFFLLTVLAPGSRQWGLGEFRLGSWILGYAVLAYGFATFSLTGELTGDLRVIDKSLILDALALLAIGFTAFTLSYRLSRKQDVSAAEVRTRSTNKRAGADPTRLIAAYAAGAAATVGLIAVQGGYGYLGGSNLTEYSSVSPLVQPLTILAFLRTAALFGVSVSWTKDHRPGTAVWLVLLGLAEVAFGLVTGVKESFVVVALAVGIPIVINRHGRVPWLRVVAAVAVFVLVVTPFVTSLRGEVRTGGDRLDFASSFTLGINSLLGRSATTSEASRDENVQQVTARIRMVDNMLVIIDQTPDTHAFRSPGDLVAAPFTGLVPRAVWPDKPLRLSGADFYHDYYRGQGNSSSAITFQGSLYMHGGGGIVVIGMVLLGAVVRRIDDSVARSLTIDPSVALLPLILFIPVAKQELEVTTLLASVPIYFLTYVIARRAVTVTVPGTSTAPRPTPRATVTGAA